MKQLILLSLFLITISACTVHVAGPENPLISNGEPVVVTLTTGSPTEGELLEVTGAEIITSDNGKLFLIPFSKIATVKIERYKKTIKNNLREELTLYSRYPQGLSDGQRQQLLREAGQDDFLQIGEIIEDSP